MTPIRKKDILRVLTLVCLAVFLFSLWNLLGIYQEYKEAEELYEQTAQNYMELAAGPESAEDDEREHGVSVKPKTPQAPIRVDFSNLLQINQDIIGWIYMEDTVVNYPLLQGVNNFYYLDKTYYKKYLASGSIYLDCDNERDFSDAHSIIFGHNMKNHTMFGDLSDFHEESYLKEHPYVDIILTDGTWLRYEIFSMYRAHIDDGTYRAPLNKAENFKPFMELVTEKNMHAASQLDLPQVQANDRVLTLSTCTEDSADLERFVVHAVLISQDGESVREK